MSDTSDNVLHMTRWRIVEIEETVLEAKPLDKTDMDWERTFLEPWPERWQRMTGILPTMKQERRRK